MHDFLNPAGRVREGRELQLLLERGHYKPNKNVKDWSYTYCSTLLHHPSCHEDHSFQFEHHLLCPAEVKETQDLSLTASYMTNHHS